MFVKVKCRFDTVAKALSVPSRARAEVPRALGRARGAGRQAAEGGEGTGPCESM